MNTSNNLLKPVRIVSTEQIKAFTSQVLSGLERAIKFMTEQDVKLTPLDNFLMPIETYIESYKKRSILLKIHAEESFNGENYWFFELKTAVLLGSFLRMMTPDAKKEKILNETFDATDEDSFGEVGNQLCGIMDRIFRTLTTKKVHLRLDFNKNVYPNEAITLSNFINKEEYVVFLANITFPEDGTQKITLLIPRSLFEVLLNMELQLEGLTPKNLLLYSYNKDFCQEMQRKFNTRFTKVVVAKDPDDIFHLAKSLNPAAIAMEFETFSMPFNHNDNIFIKRILANESLKKAPFIFTVNDGGPMLVDSLQKAGLNAAANVKLQDAFEPWVKKIIIL